MSLVMGRLHTNLMMNSLVKELAKQAFLQASTDLRTNDLGPSQEQVLEKFAELIISECVEQLEQAKNSPFVGLDDAKRMSHFVDVSKKKISKHFGIK